VGVKTLVPRGLLRMASGRVTMVIHPPVSTEGRTANEAALLAEEIRSRVADGCART
jgi:hypothetical protein